MTKAPSPTENSKKQNDNIKTPKKIDYGTIADRRRTVSWNDNNHQAGLFEQVYGIPNSHLPQKLCNQKDSHLKFCKKSSL